MTMNRFTKRIFTLVAFIFPFYGYAEIITVPSVDASKYVGEWYQISHIPLFFEGGVCPCARQRLSAIDSKTLGVYNSCNDKTIDGKLKEIKGTADSDDVVSNSKWTVDFGLPWKGTYWIVGLDESYRYAVVTDKDGKSLYVLSKTPSLDPSLYQQAVDMAASQGLKTSDLQMTLQNGCSYP